MRRALWLLAGLAVMAVFLVLSLGARRAGFEVCLRWKGRPGCGRAWARTPGEALRAATDNACGPLSTGLVERMSCSRVKPERVTPLERP